MTTRDEEVLSKSRYSNTGLWAAEKLFAETHERAGQYLDQAPVLVMWALPWVDFQKAGAQTFARSWIVDMCEQGVPLKEFIRTAGMTAPMRALRASVLQPSHAAVYRMLARVPTAVLGRAIPSTVKGQRAWLRGLAAWMDGWKRRGWISRNDDLFVWCVERFDETVSPSDAHDLADFHASGQPFNLAWGLKRAREEREAWHARITLARQIRGLPFGADDQIDLGRHEARPVGDAGLIFLPLRTAREIAEEGSAMRHCVGSYISQVANGTSHIVSIRRGERRVATLEMAGPKRRGVHWVVSQIRGPRNAAVPKDVSEAARFYAECCRLRDASA